MLLSFPGEVCFDVGSLAGCWIAIGILHKSSSMISIEVRDAGGHSSRILSHAASSTKMGS